MPTISKQDRDHFVDGMKESLKGFPEKTKIDGIEVKNGGFEAKNPREAPQKEAKEGNDTADSVDRGGGDEP